jgi:hypothetical protein
LAVERFVNVGETTAYENSMIKTDMLNACKEARAAGYAIKECTKAVNSVANIIGLVLPKNADLMSTNTKEKRNMIQAANNLLNSVTHVLLLADVIIINQILNSKNKVLATLFKLENVIDVNSFMTLFKQYGVELVELAYLSGERQNDLKDDKRRSQLSSSRWILEKSTLMILSTSKAFLKHVDCECAKENLSQVYQFLYKALDTLNYVVVDSGSLFDFNSNSTTLFPSAVTADDVGPSFSKAYSHFEVILIFLKN